MEVPAWVPAGATVRFTLSGVITPASWVSEPFYRDSYDAWVSELGGQLLASDFMVGMDDRVVGGDWEDRSWGPISSNVWTNPGPSRWVKVGLTPRYRMGDAGQLLALIDVVGGDGASPAECGPLADQVDVPNRAMPNSCGAQPNAADPVNVVQGNFWQSWEDVVLPGRGPGLALGRTYSSSRADADGPLGFGWSWSYGMSLVEASGVVSVRQENGAMVRFTDAAGAWGSPPGVNATLVKNGDGSWTFTRSGTEVFGFSPAGALTSVSDLSGNTVTLSYVGSVLASVTDASGRQLLFTWSGGRIAKVTAPPAVLEAGGAAVPMEISYGYDAEGNLVSVTETDGGVWTFTYDGAHRMLTVREPRHHALGAAAPVVENSYDAQGRVVWQEDRLDRRTTFDWSSAARTVVTDPMGRSTVYEHDDGICSGIVRDPGPNESRWTFEVDPATLGRTSTTDPNGRVTTATFTGRGLPQTVTGPSGTTTVVYDERQLPTSVTDPSGVATTMTYDPGTDRLRRVSRPITPGTGTWSVTLNYTDPMNPGLPTELIDARGQSWTYAYDAFGNLVSSTDPTGKTATTSYNELGWPIESVAPAGNAPGGVPGEHATSRVYNAAGEVVAVTDPLGAVTEYGLDPSGYLEWVSDPVPAGEPTERTTLGWNAAGELTAVTRPDASTVTTDYWPDGSLKAQHDGASNTTGYGYDSQGRLSTITDPAGRVTTLGHNPAGQLVFRQQHGGDCAAAVPVGCISYGYTADGDLGSVDYSDPATPDVVFAYDALGQRTSMTDDAGTSIWVWDSIGRLLSFTDPVAGTVGYGYADAGPLATSITQPGGKVVNRTFDAAGRQDTLTGWAGGTTAFGYDDNTNPTTTDTQATTGVEDTVAYDRANRATAFTLRQDQSVLASLGYTRDPEGMVRSSTGSGLPGVADAFGYTALDQLASDHAGTYTFDAADNLTGFPDGRRQRFNAANELCHQATTDVSECGSPPSGARTFGYDSRGNRTSDTVDGQARTLSYDQADRLTAYDAGVRPDGGGYTAASVTRALDTRSSSGNCTNTNGAPATCKFTSGGQRLNVQVNGLGGVPTSDVEAVVVHVTGLNATSAGSVKVNAPGTGIAAGTISVDSGVSANAEVIAKPDENGRINVYTSVVTDVVIDVIGWYASSGTGGSTFTAVTPARAADTRNGTGVCPTSTNPTAVCTQLVGGQTKKLKLAGVANIPSSGVTAVAINVTTASPTMAGYVQVNRIGSSAEATFNYKAGESTGGMAIANLAADGTVTLYSNRDTHLMVDTNGWFGSDGASTYRPVSPARILDTRYDIGSCNGQPCDPITSGQTLKVQTTGRDGIPANGVEAVILNLTVFGTGAGYVKVNGTSSAAVTINLTSSSDKEDTIVIAEPDANGQISLYASGATFTVIADASGYFSRPTTTYAYSGDGVRRTKTLPDGTTVNYVWDRSGSLPLLLAEAIDAPGTSHDGTIRYLYGPTGKVLADITQPASGSETLRWYHHDQLGSTRALTDHTGTTLATFAYSPFGEVTSSTGTATTPIGWAGEYRDEESGYIYLRARYYDPTTGQFLTRDPAVSITREPYGYAGNDPVNNVDPMGLWDIPTWVPVVGGMCVDINDPDCESPRDGHSTDLSRGVVNFAGAALDMNPIYRGVEAAIEAVSDCDIDLASQGVDRSSGWYTAGQASMVVVDVGSGTAWATGARFRFAVHDAHHTFGALGKLPHLQWNFWRQGVKGSGFPIRIPLPRWFK